MTYRVRFQTFGCKLNQLETESLAEAFAASGAQVLGGEGEADLHILNTCTVTARAEAKARRALRLALEANPAAVVLVTGCYAQMEAGLGEGEARVVLVKGEDKDALHDLARFLAETGPEKGELLEVIRGWLLGRAREGAEVGKRPLFGPIGNSKLGRFAYSPESFAFHSRPSIKIEDGCDNRCSYCRVCLARGPAVSLPPSAVLERLVELERAGAAEVVLSGVNLSQYRSEGLDFAGLLRFLLASSTRLAIRLSSFEPDRIDAAFLEAFAEPRIRPHLHLAVQSGSDAVLKRMGRHYGRRAVLEACAALRRVKGDPFLGADLIAGFPGEGEEDFASSLALVAEAGLASVQAFCFSPRPGTPAFDMDGAVPESLARRRAELLSAAGKKGRLAYVDRQIGSVVEAIVEGGPGPGRRATSANYLKLRLEEGAALSLAKGRALTCRILPATSSEGGGPSLGEHFDADALFLSTADKFLL
jgi:threonylcarbamoyladenosine tRNA methylthiotransferase MtaB